MNLVEALNSKIFKGILIFLASLVVLLMVFRLGMVVGFQKANFSYQWGENYHTIFGGPSHGWFQQIDKDDYINGNGVVGTVIQANSSTLTIRGNDNTEKSVIIDDQTVIEKNHQTIKLGDIKTDEHVIIIGTPSSTGQVDAIFIRVFGKGDPLPPPPQPVQTATDTDKQ